MTRNVATGNRENDGRVLPIDAWNALGQREYARTMDETLRNCAIALPVGVREIGGVRMLRIACDESGHTGRELTNKDQTFFAYASINMDDDEAWTTLDGRRKKHRIQLSERQPRAGLEL